jgi:hypothetical protein
MAQALPEKVGRHRVGARAERAGIRHSHTLLVVLLSDLDSQSATQAIAWFVSLRVYYCGYITVGIINVVLHKCRATRRCGRDDGPRRDGAVRSFTTRAI